MANLKLAVIQFKPIFGDKNTNITKINTYINNIDADILVFPEMSTSGYFYLSKDELYEIADEFAGETIAKFQELSTTQNKIIIFGFPEKEKDKLYNSAVILLPDKNKSRVYRKTHLFYKEFLSFSPGNSGFFIVEDKEKDIKIGLMICYDWRFPEASRTLALMGADLIVCPSNLVTPVWNKVMPARAIENKVYLAVSNRIGKEIRGEEELFFNGESVIYGYNGDRMAKAGVEEEKVIFAEIDPVLTRKKSFNEYNDVFLDRRPDMYKM